MIICNHLRGQIPETTKLMRVWKMGKGIRMVERDLKINPLLFFLPKFFVKLEMQKVRVGT